MKAPDRRFALLAPAILIVSLAFPRGASAQPDGSVPEDAGIEAGVDAGESDAGESDAGESDAGEVLDATSTPEPPKFSEALEEAIGMPEGATNTVVRTLVGLVGLLAIAYLASHRKVQHYERVLGVSQVVTAGFPFVALGLLARAPGIELMTEESVTAITPVLQFGLGWIGFRTGFQFDVRAIDKLPRGTLQVIALLAVAPLVVVSLAVAATLLAFGHGAEPHKVLRNAAMLGAAGALTAPTVARVVRIRGFSDEDVDLARSLGLLDDLAGVLGLMFVSTFVRSPAPGSTWNLPGAGWILVTLGLAVVLGLVVHLMLRGADRGADRAALLIGSVAFSAGIAGVLQLSPLVVCFLTGAILRNLRSARDPLGPVFERFERPIYLVFLAVAGALWEIDDYRGWVLVPVLVVARIVGRYLGMRAARRIVLDSHDSELVREADTGLLVAPMGSLAIALVMSMQTLYVSRYVPLFVTAVIGGSIVLEILVQLTSRTRAAANEAES